MSNLKRTLFATAITTSCGILAFANQATTRAHTVNSALATIKLRNPFTHEANLPDGTNLSSVRFERVRLVRLATQVRSAPAGSSCEEASNRDPGGSILCMDKGFQSLVSAYEVTYSYRGQPLASDEYGGTYLTFSVYLHPEEVDPDLSKRLSEHDLSKAAAARFFQLSTHRVSAQQIVVDEAASAYCRGNYVDGSWVRTDSRCADKVATRTITAPAEYITVRVDPAKAGGLASNPQR